MEALIGFGIIAVVISVPLFFLFKGLARLARKVEGMGQKMFCPSCGFVGPSKKIIPGSMGTGLVLWLLMLIPGMIYSLWRLAAAYSGCPTCKGKGLIPADSPMARKFLETPKQTA